MSVAAIPIYNALVEQGMPPERAQEAAEAAAEAQRKALEEIAERKTAETEKTLRGEMAVAAERAAAQAERAAAQTEQVRRESAAQTEQVRRESVTREEFHQRNAELATRGEMHAEFAKVHAQFAEIRTELRALNRIIIIGLISIPTILLAAGGIAVSLLLGMNPAP